MAHLPPDPYGFSRWGHGLVTVMDNGDAGLLNPSTPDAPPVSLPRILANLDERGIRAPVLLRVASTLDDSIATINQGFENAMAASGYKGRYRGVFPVKVNQQAQVVARIVEAGRRWSFGLEAGSKPELVIALAQPLEPDAIIVCNGVKDTGFVRLAIQSRQAGFETVIVLESPDELETVLKVSREIGLEPLLGVRVKLFNRISGDWAESSGDRSTFGMNAAQILDVVDRLRQEELLHCLRLQHSHLGSQIPDVNDSRRATVEACRMFVELSKEGAPLQWLDLGGGLGHDYTGEKRASKSSINYSVEEYCTNIVETVGFAMDEAGIDHPTLVTESGRAVVASSSIFLFEALEATLYDSETMAAPEPDDHHHVHDLAGVAAYITPPRIQEALNDAEYFRREMRSLFMRGSVSLRQMARAERIYLGLMARIKAVARDMPDDAGLAERLEALADIYHCNYSLFQSLPDVWAIGQLHPTAPIQRLNEEPMRRAILSDITCDSDGKLDRFILADGVSPSLPVHDLVPGGRYHFGAFFVGAYQETLGDLHNLFGDTNVVTIALRRDGGFDLLEEVGCDTVAEVLSYVEYDVRDCIDAFRKRLDKAASEDRLTSAGRKTLMESYRAAMASTTYYE